MKHQKDKIMIVIEVKVVITNEKALKKLIKFGKINSGGTRKLVGENQQACFKKSETFF